jgi:pimeloyl-ACP methyl ester carboxylesterase
LALLFTGLIAGPIWADTPQDAVSVARFPAAVCAPDGTQTSGAKYRVCMPSLVPWNRDLLVFAHGYVPPNAPIAIPEDQMVIDGQYLPDAAGMLGYAFATTSYSVNGLAVRPALDDLVELVALFRAAHPTVRRVYLVGVSEGGLIATLAAEQAPGAFDGALAMCGPIGDFSAQTNYFGDFRNVMDFFFPGLLPGSPISVPQALMDNWETYRDTVVAPRLMDPSSLLSMTQVLQVTQAAIDPANPISSAQTTTAGVLWYNVFATNDAIEKLGGQPYDNSLRVYTGSYNDAALNLAIQRFTASPVALARIATDLTTTGNPRIPLVTMHNTLDPIVPYLHEPLYQAKVTAQGRAGWYAHYPVQSYGHCAFTLPNVQRALTDLAQRVNNADVIYLPLLAKTASGN